MFESWVSDLLASSLGHFIDVQRDKLRVSLWNGVVIENASIRKDAFDYLDLPFKVHYGCIGRLQLQVPWRALRTSPIVVELSDVTLAASPREESEWCGDAAARRAMAAKQAQLAAAELEKLSAKVAAERGGDGKNLRWLLMSHVWSLLLRRVQLHVRDVHILFECPQSPHFLGFSFGMRVGSVQTVDESLELARSKEACTVGEIMKAVAVKEVAIYWRDGDSDEMIDSDYLMEPLDCQFQIMFQTTSQKLTQFEVRGQVDEVKLQISRQQLTQMAHFAECMAIWSKRRKYGKFRPEEWRPRWPRQVNPDGGGVSWDRMWKYAVKSVFQDLHDLQPGFSLARLKLWQQWRRRYVALYLRHVETVGKEGRGVGVARELQELEAELPVPVVMLFRSIAEEAIEHKAEGGPDDPTNQPSRVRGWLGWGMSGLWGFLGYTSSTSMGAISLPEPPSEVEIAELYKALGLQPMQSGDNRQPQPAPLLASLRIEVNRVQATVRDECGSAKETSPLISIHMSDCEAVGELETDNWHCSVSMTDLNVDNWCIPSGSAETIVSRRELAAGSKRGRSFPAVFVSFHSSSGSPQSGKDPFLRIRLDPLKITVRPELIKRLESMTDGFPTSTLSAWIARCISLLPTRRARMLAKAQHVAYSQSTLRTEIELHSCLIHLPCNADNGHPLDLAAEIELLQLVSNPVEDAMDSVKVLREIEHGHTLQTDGGMCMGSENVESVLFDDLERRLLYRRWAVTVHGFELMLQRLLDEEPGHSLGSEVLVEKLSSTGNLLINRMQGERSSPAIQCDCRCSAFGVTLSGSQLDSLNQMIRTVKNELAEMPNMGSIKDCSGNPCNAMVPKKLSYGSLDVDMVLPEAPDSKLGIEFSLAAPKMRFVFEDGERADGNYFVGGSLPCSFVGVSQTVNIGVSLESSMDNISVSMQGFNLQDVGGYTGKKIMPKAKIPRLAKNINIGEVTLSVGISPNGDINVTGLLDGADGTAYPGEVAGYLKPSSSPANATGRFSFQRVAKSKANKLDISLENGCFGSTFITRILAQFFPGSSEKTCRDKARKHSEVVYISDADREETHAELGGFVEPDYVESFTLLLKLKNCHAVFPKGAQHMAGILGVPGGHCGALLKVSSLSFRAAFLDGFKHGHERWSSIEINKLHIRDAILMTSRGPHSCLLAPLVEVGEVKVTSTGTVFSNGTWPFEWHASPASISYSIEVKSPHVSVDLERLEVVSCALNEAFEKFQSFIADTVDHAQKRGENPVHPDSSQHDDGHGRDRGMRPMVEMCVPYRDVSVAFHMSQLMIEMAGQSSSLCATVLELKSVELSYRAMYLRRRGENLSRSSEASPFQADCSIENRPPEPQTSSYCGDPSILLGKPPSSSQSSVGTPVEASQMTAEPEGPPLNPIDDEKMLDIPRLERCGMAHWESLVLAEGKLDISSCFYYYLSPDGRILEHTKEDEADLIANETDNPGLAMALWAPVKAGEFEGQISGSASSVASFETAGSNFSIARRTGTNSTGITSTADEELAPLQISRTVSFNSNAEMEELWEEAVSLNPVKSDNFGSSELLETDTGRVILASISTSIDDGRFVVWWSKQLEGEVEPDVSFEAPKLDVCVNVCSWTTTFHTILEASQIIKQYDFSKRIPVGNIPPPSQSPGSSVSIKVCAAGMDLMVGSIGESEPSTRGNVPLFPCVMMECGAFSVGFSEEVSMSLGSCSVSSCWVACDDLGDRHWRIQKSADRVLLMGHMKLTGFMKSDRSSDEGALHEVGLKLSVDSVKIWCSYHRSMPLLLVADRVRRELALAPPDRGECGSPHDDSTSNKSSFLNIVSNYGGASQHRSSLIEGFGKVEFQLGVISLMLSDDRSQTDFPLVDACVENLCLEAKRERGSDLVVWGAEFCPKLSLYNRQKMGWEVFVEPWSLKISAESRLNSGAVRQSGRQSLLSHTLLRCISDQSLQLTISPGMLQTVGILTELFEVMSNFSLDRREIKPDLWEPGSYKSRFFTTHWLHNETGAAFYFWTTREGVATSAVAEESGMYVGAEPADPNGMPLRAVAVSERMTLGASAKRQLSLSEVTLAKCSESQIDSCGSTTTSGSGDFPWLVNSLSDSFKRNGKLPSVNEGDTKGTVAEGSERMPVGVGVVASGFSGEGHDPTYDHVSFSRHRHMRLYFKLEAQECACGPVTLDTVGAFRHLVRVPDMCSESTPGTSDSDRKWMKAEVICEVTQRKLGGFDVAMHSVARVCNETSMKLEIGCWEDDDRSAPVVKLIEPGNTMWLPVMTATKGTVCLRPHPESNDPWAMRWGWSQAWTPQEVTKKLLISPKIFSHLRCDPVSGGLKPMWLNLGAKKNSGGLFADIYVESPVVVHNFLPLTANVTLRCLGGVLSGMKGKIEPRCCIKGHTLQGASIDHITLSPLGYNEAQIQSLPQVEGLVKDVRLGELTDSTEDSKVAEVIVKVERESAGHVPVCIRHFVEGFTGRHIFEICCALWVYNCTGISVALREHQEDDHFVDEEAVRIPDDQVPNRWVPPYIDAKLEETPSSSRAKTPEARSLSHPNLSMPASSSPMRHSRAVGEVGGLKDLLQTGDPVKFKIRTGWCAHHSPLERRALKMREPMGTKFPWMEVGGPPRQRRLRLQLRASRAQAPQGSDYWSSPLSVDSLGGAAIVQVPCPIHTAASRPSYPTAAYFFAVTAHPIPRAGGAWALHVMPRYILKNTTSVPIQYRQQGIPVERDLPVDACRGIQWPDARWPLRLNLRIREAGWLWSGGISLESPGDTFVKVRHRHREETMLFQVDVSMTGSGVLMASLSHQAAGFAPYRLDNCTNEKLHVRQEGCREQEDILRPYSSIPYAWDEPAGPHKIVLELAGHRHIGTMKLDEVGTAKQVTLRPDPSSPYTNMKRKLRIVVAAEGPTRVLVVMDEAVHPSSVIGNFSRSASHERLGWHSWSSPDMGQISKQTVSLESRVGLEVGVHLSGVGVSFVSLKKELMYAWISEPQLRFAMGKVRYTLECAVARFQLDNCTRDAVYPVLFRGPTTTIGNRLPAITLRASIWRRRPGGVVCLEQLHLNVAPLALEIEEEHMGEISQFYDSHIKTIMDRPGSSREKHEPDVVMLENGKAWSKVVPQAKVYIESLIISKMDITFSFCPASWRLSSQEKTSPGGAMGSSVLQRFLALADVEAAQIYINGLALKHPLLSQRALGTLVERHYMRGLVQEVYKVVGSADLLGDPARLVHHLGLGVWSLFSNPAAALEETSTRLQIPQRVLWGLMVGIRSLMSNTIFAFSNATAKLSLTARKGLVVLGLEDEGRLRLTRRGMTRNARLALTESLDSGLVEAILGGLGGLLSEPVRGVDEAGLIGLFRGMVRGFVGVLVRPLASSLEMSSRVADSIQVLVSGYQGPLPLMRVPRSVDPAAPLQPYDKLDAIGALILREVANGMFKSDILLACLEVSMRGCFAVVTHRHLLIVTMMEPNSLYSFPELNKQVNLDEIELVKLMGTKVGLLGLPILRPWGRNNNRGLGGRRRSPFDWSEIDCGDSCLASELAGRLVYACRHGPKRIKRVGWGLFVDNRI